MVKVIMATRDRKVNMAKAIMVTRVTVHKASTDRVDTQEWVREISMADHKASMVLECMVTRVVMVQVPE